MENPQENTAPETNDFLARMDQEKLLNQAKAKKQKKSIIIVIVLLFLLVGGAAVFLLLSKKDESVKTTTSPKMPEVDAEMEARNEQRKNDLDELGAAVRKYQEDAGGMLPGREKDTWNKLIAKYVKDGVIKDSADGAEYKFGKTCGLVESDCIDISSLSWEENKHQFYVMYYADCSGDTKDNVVVSTAKKRHVAIFAPIEDGKFICATND